ncbi:MAG: hypothetical protein RI957_1097 [Verrucomicrobiota bacterium]|jgi:hypothetical protein
MNFLTRFFLLCFAFLPGGWIGAQETYFRNVFEPKYGSYVEVTSLFSKLPSSGFAPVRVTIANRTGVPVSVVLHFQSESSGYYGSGSLSTKSSFTASSPAGIVTTTDYLVPVAATVKNISHSMGANTQILRLSMVGVSNGNHVQTSTNSPEFPYLLMSESLSTPNGSALDGELNKHLHGSLKGYVPGNLAFAGKFDPKAMPEDWRAYIGHDGMLLTDHDWLNMTPGARSAILQWNRQGGYLRVFASNTSSTLESLTIKTDDSGGDKIRSKGTVKISPIPPALTLDAAKTLSEIVSSSNLWTRQVKSVVEDYGSGSWGLHKELGTKTFHFLLFILVLIAFGVLVGPVNLFVFAKSGMRHKLFITTPLIAIGASVLMIILIFIQDGMGGRGIRIQWIELVRENGDNNAYVHQEQVSRTGVLVGNRFLLADPASISPLPMVNSQWTRLSNTSTNDQSYEMNVVNKGLQVSGDWFQSRSEQAQMIRAVVPTRARIEFTDPANELSLLSNFEHEIDAIYYRGKGGKFWCAEKIPSGKNFLARECTQADFDNFVDKARANLGNSQQQHLERLAQRQGYYIALASQAPMIETFSAIRWTQNTTIITGRVESPEAP